MEPHPKHLNQRYINPHKSFIINNKQQLVHSTSLNSQLRSNKNKQHFERSFHIENLKYSLPALYTSTLHAHRVFQKWESCCRNVLVWQTAYTFHWNYPSAWTSQYIKGLYERVNCVWGSFSERGNFNLRWYIHYVDVFVWNIVRSGVL